MGPLAYAPARPAGLSPALPLPSFRPIPGRSPAVNRFLKPLTLALAISAAFAAQAQSLTIDQSQLPALPHFAKADTDANAAICNDLNAHVNSKWLAANPVPGDRTTWGSFEMLGERSLAVQKQIVEAAAKADAAQ